MHSISITIDSIFGLFRSLWYSFCYFCWFYRFRLPRSFGKWNYRRYSVLVTHRIHFNRHRMAIAKRKQVQQVQQQFVSIVSHIRSLSMRFSFFLLGFWIVSGNLSSHWCHLSFISYGIITKTISTRTNTHKCDILDTLKMISNSSLFFPYTFHRERKKKRKKRNWLKRKKTRESERERMFVKIFWFLLIQ